MSISVACPYGHKLNAKEKLAGKRVKCPKCGSVVQIPELESDILMELVADEPPPDPVPDPLGFDASSGLLGDANEPLGDLSDPLAGDLGDWDVQEPVRSLRTPVAPVASHSPTQKPAAASKSPSNLSLTLILALAGGGVAIGFLCTGVLGWFLLLRGSGNDTPAIDPSSHTVADVRPAPQASPSPVAPDVNHDVAPDVAPSSPSPSTPAPAPEVVPEVNEVPVRQPKPWDLTPVAVDRRLSGFKLPATTWAAAYDEVTGRLAVTHDKQGILIYNIDKLAGGEFAPEAMLPTRGLPMAVCLKPLANRRAFVVAGQEDPHLLLVDAETLMPFGKLQMQDLQFVDFLIGSPNPADPYVYYSVADQQPDKTTAGKLGRVNLLTGKQDGHTTQEFVDVAISPEGGRLYARPNSTANGIAGDWSELRNFNGNMRQTQLSQWSRNYATSPLRPLDQVVAIRSAVYTPSMNIKIANPDYSPVAAFPSRALVWGLSSQEIVVGSANDYRRLLSIALPSSWLRTDRSGHPQDVRLRYEASPIIKSAFFDMKADDARGLGLMITGEHLVIAQLDQLQLPAEPSLAVATVLPDRVTPGNEVRIDLAVKPAAATVEYVPNTDWLPNEKTPLLGELPAGQPSPHVLELHSGVSAGQDFVMFKNYKPLAKFRMPFKLRIGNEVMIATKYERVKLIVQRTAPVTHGFTERIAVVDDAGRILTKPPASVKPLGKRIVLAAAINNQQEIIFVNKLDSIAGEKLPATIQNGDEQMTLTGVDDFKSALLVKRTEPVSHSVSSEAWLLERQTEQGPTADPVNLPKVADGTLHWTPSPSQLGKQTIRFRATVGNVSREWFWEVNVERGIAELPFQVVGIEPDPASTRAVIWGQSVLPYVNPTSTKPVAPISYYLGIYDHKEKKLVKHVQVPKPIMAAVLDKTGVYVSLVAFDMVPKADRQAERAREHATRQITPTQIVRFDPETLEVAAQVAVPRHCKKLQVIGGKYLAAFERWRGDTLRFNISDLTAIEPPLLDYEYPTAGRLRDGWLWDGVVWNHDMTEPQLLLFPVHFELPRPHARSEMIAAAGGTIHQHNQGPFTCTWCPINAKLEGQYELTDFPAGLSCTGGMLHAFSWAAPSQQTVGATAKPTSVKLLDLNSVVIQGDRRTQMQRAGGYVSEANGIVHTALLGKLYQLPLTQLVRQEETFRIVERQDQFVLDPSKPITLSYSAPGASNYELQVWRQRPSFHDDEPALTAKSTDGRFKLAAGAITVSPGKYDADYLKRIKAPFKRLTGRNPRSGLEPIYVSVIAQHQDGQQKAGLSHCYLVEVRK